MAHGISLTTVTLSSPEPRALARFYADLLGWQPTTDEPDWVVLAGPDPAGVRLAFHVEEQFEAPRWPSERGKQSMQGHLELAVDDLVGAVEHALSCGARLADHQPQDDVRVCLDPDGHPFCLYVE